MRALCKGTNMRRVLVAILLAGCMGVTGSSAFAQTKGKPDEGKSQPGQDKPSQDKPSQRKPAQKKPAPEATLKVGSEAPKLSVETWVKGDSVGKFEEGKVYVVEFWATWCPPCIEAIPHLSELQERHKQDGLTVIGVAGSERQKSQGGDDTRLKGVQQFVRGKGKQMNYTVAFDADRSMAAAWMVPAGKSGIPCSFVVGHDGKIAWIGNPHSESFESEIEKALAAANGKKKDDAGGQKKKQEGETDAEKRKKDQKAPFKKDK